MKISLQLFFLIVFQLVFSILLIESTDVNLNIFYIFSQGVVLVYVISNIFLPRKISNDILNPINILFVLFILHFIGVSYYNSIVGFIPTDMEHYIDAHISLFIFFTIFVFSFNIFLRLNKKETHGRDLVFAVSDGMYYLFIVTLTVISLSSIAYFIWSAGGIQNHFNSLSLRYGYFLGRGVQLSLVHLMTSAAILMYILMLKQNLKKNKILNRTRIIFLLLIVLGVFSALFTGSRGSLIFMILILLFIKHYCIKPFKVQQLSVIASAILMFLFLFIAFIRQPSLGEEIIATSSFSNVPQQILKNLYGKGTFKELNSVARVHERIEDKGLILGESIISIVTFPIPRSWFAEKPESASNIFTKTMRPDIWESGRGDRVTFAGELLMNFGQIGVVFGSIFIAYLLSKSYLKRVVHSEKIYDKIVYSFVFSWFFILIRSDISISTTQFLRVLIPTIFVFVLVRIMINLKKN
jgi:oligosaccharide repeat unit polymerase